MTGMLKELIITFDIICSMLLRCIGVKLGSNLIILHQQVFDLLYLFRSLETHVFHKMRGATNGVLFIGRSHFAKHIEMGDRNGLGGGLIEQLEPIFEPVSFYYGR
jgi:hypothetical protein